MAASSLLDVCRFNPTLGGTTDWTYSSAVTGYQSPSAAGVVNGAQYSYRAESADLSQWEVGTGTYNTGTGVLSRTTVLFNSSGTTSKISFTVAPQVAIVALAEDLPFSKGLTSFTSVATGDTALSAGVWATGASISQGTSGTWLVTAQIAITDSSTNQQLKARITDGTTVFSSGTGVNFNATNGVCIAMSAIVTNPAGNLLVQGNDPGANGTIRFNYSGQSKDTQISAVRIA